MDLFADKLSEITSKISNENKESYIMGDFNIDLLKFQTHGKTNDFIESMISKGYLPLITKPTRVTTYSATLSDHIYSNATSQNYDSRIIISDVADHFGTFYASRKYSSKNIPTYTRTRQMKQVNISNFKQLLSSTDFNSVLSDGNNYTITTRHHHHIFKTRPRTTFSSKLPNHNFVNIWNEIDENLKLCSSKVMFKQLIRKRYTALYLSHVNCLNRSCLECFGQNM